MRSTEAITIAATRLASFGKPIVGALAHCHPVPILPYSQFGEDEEYELIGAYKPQNVCPISPKDDDSNTDDDTKTGIDGSMDDSDSK